LTSYIEAVSKFELNIPKTYGNVCTQRPGKSHKSAKLSRSLILRPNCQQIELETITTESKPKDAAIDIHEPTEEQGKSSPPESPSSLAETAAKPKEKLGPYKYAPESVGDNWEKCLAAVEKYDNDMCTSWKEDIDTLLVFVSPNFLKSIYYLT
jgi:hypothetical protein